MTEDAALLKLETLHLDAVDETADDGKINLPTL